MAQHMTGTRQEWLAARLKLLEDGEGAHAAQRRAGASAAGTAMGSDRQGVSIRDRRGDASLADLFRGRSQLLVYHFMFGPDYSAGCPSCSAIADGFNGFAVHLANHDVMLWAVRGRRSRSCWRTSSGWGGRSLGRPLSAATSTPTSTSRSPKSNSAREATNTTTGARRHWSCVVTRGPVRPNGGHVRNRHGHIFAREAGHERVRARGQRRVSHLFHYARGLDGLWGMYQWLDRAPKGRNESGIWWRRHDEYDKP